MTLKHLQIFSEVCHHESITQAADLLNMAQPAVSKAVKELESFYGVQLFERMSRKIYLTSAGASLLSYADSILSQFAESREILQDIEASSRIRIGSNVAYGTIYLPELLSHFQQIHPEIPIYTRIQNSAIIEAALSRNELDLAIIDQTAQCLNTHRKTLLTETMIAVCSPTFSYLSQKYVNSAAASISFAEFAAFPLLLRESGSGTREIISQLFKERHASLNIAVESTSTQSLIRFCEKGMGVLFVPQKIIQPMLDSKQLMKLTIENIALSRSYDLIYHESKFLTKSMKYFLKYACK